MKTFTFTFILYILLLLTQPCQDAFAQVSGNDKSDPVNIQHPIEGNEQPEDCSPFCICACRQIPSAYQHFTSVAILDVAAAVTPPPTFEYQNPYTKNFYDSIWQPPKA